MIIDTTLSAMEKRMDGFRRLDQAVERKHHSQPRRHLGASITVNYPWSEIGQTRIQTRIKKAKEEKDFEARMQVLLDKVLVFMELGKRSSQKNREPSG